MSVKYLVFVIILHISYLSSNSLQMVVEQVESARKCNADSDDEQISEAPVETCREVKDYSKQPH